MINELFNPTYIIITAARVSKSIYRRKKTISINTAVLNKNAKPRARAAFIGR